VLFIINFYFVNGNHSTKNVENKLEEKLKKTYK